VFSDTFNKKNDIKVNMLVSLEQVWGTYLLSRAAWNVHYRWRAAKSVDFNL